MNVSTTNRLRLIALDDERHDASDFADAVREGLAATPKRLPCRFFYDETGSRLFEEICDLPEYYLTRAEREILRAHADDIAERFRARTTLVELGSGSSFKTRILIEAFLQRHGALRYVPVDISRTMLEESARALIADYPGLEILAVAAEYRRGLHSIHSQESAPKLILWLGSSVGNYTDVEATRLLAGISTEMKEGDRLLLGADLRKDPAVLLRAYDDAAGVTACFNQNVLARINRELGGEFRLDRFRHEARWNEGESRIEMHLVSECAQNVRIAALGRSVVFAAGESIHTENSHKYSRAEITSIAQSARLAPEAEWLDTQQRFGLWLLRPTHGGMRH